MRLEPERQIQITLGRWRLITITWKAQAMEPEAKRPVGFQIEASGLLADTMVNQDQTWQGDN